MNRAEAVSKFPNGTYVRYIGKGYPHLQGFIGVVVGVTEAGFLRVSYPDRTHKISRINPAHVEIEIVKG